MVQGYGSPLGMKNYLEFVFHLVQLCMIPCLVSLIEKRWMERLFIMGVWLRAEILGKRRWNDSNGGGRKNTDAREEKGRWNSMVVPMVVSGGDEMAGLEGRQ